MSTSQTQRHAIRGMLADLKMPGSLEAVDAILAKVKREGITSLTRREKKALQRATERERDRDQSIARG